MPQRPPEPFDLSLTKAPKVVQNRVITGETLQSKQCLQSTIGPQLIEMGKTARSSNDAQHKAHKDLARLVMIGTFGLIELSALELFNQSNPSQKLDQNRQASKGGDRSERVAEFDLSSTKKGPKFLPIVLFRRLRRILKHNLFSHKRLEQNDAHLPQANFGFWIKKVVPVFQAPSLI